MQIVMKYAVNYTESVFLRRPTLPFHQRLNQPPKGPRKSSR
jgi:hypothetical protein